MSCTPDSTWALHNIWRNVKGAKRGKNFAILGFKDCFWTFGFHEFWEKFDSRPPGAVPLITAWQERGRMKRNWHLTPVRQSQLQPTAENREKEKKIIFIFPPSCQAVINGTAPGGCQSNISQNSWCSRVPKHFSKKPNCQDFHLFSSFQISSNCYAMLMCCQKYMTCLVIHQTKPIDVGVHYAKGFWDWSTYRADTSHLKIHTNFWTHCSLGICTFLNLSVLMSFQLLPFLLLISKRTKFNFSPSTFAYLPPG